MDSSWLSQHDLVLVLVLLIMAPSSAIEFTGDNVCHRVENYTVTLKESYMEPVVVNTFSWCFEIPPRCPKPRVEMRERWRIKAEIRQKKIMDCCEGYVAKSEGKYSMVENSSAATCEPHCDMCDFGICVAPNTCQCKPGYRGDGCDYECPSGTWGEKCSRKCDCQMIDNCNAIDGSCHCPSGWQGSGCNEKCPAGLWGVDCAFPCDCVDEYDGKSDRLKLASEGESTKSMCHHETGSCMNLQQIIVPFVPPIMTYNRTDAAGERTIEIAARSSTNAFVPSTATKSSIIDDRAEFSTPPNDHDISYGIDDLADDNNDDHRKDEVSLDRYDKIDKPVKKFTEIGTGLSETSSNRLLPEIAVIETSSIDTIIGSNKYDNYNVQQRVERIDTKVPKVKKSSTPGSIVAVVHVSGNGSPDHDGPMIMTSLGTDKMPVHAVPMPLDIAALIVIGSILSLGLTTLAVLAIFHIRSKLFETIRLSIYDAEKRDKSDDTIRRGGGEKSNSGGISTMSRHSSILTCEYETPRCMIPEHRTLTRPRSVSSEITKKPETNSTYSNDYPNIRLFSNIQELLEAHYDRPPSTFRHAVFDTDGEHVYDEIPLQPSTTTKGET